MLDLEINNKIQVFFIIMSLITFLNIAISLSESIDNMFEYSGEPSI